jgi:hypothetical protein
MYSSYTASRWVVWRTGKIVPENSRFLNATCLLRTGIARPACAANLEKVPEGRDSSVQNVMYFQGVLSFLLFFIKVETLLTFLRGISDSNLS